MTTTALPTKEERRDVAQRELEWHEQESYRRHWLDAFLYDPPAFDTVVEAMLGFLGRNRTEIVLDMGCGEGKETLTLAQAGYVVIGTDLSLVQLDRARERLALFAPDATVLFVQANAEELPFADGTFQAIHGKAILHHLDLRYAAKEIGRILSTGGRATFAEPLADHPLIQLGRLLTPKLRTADERPMSYQELADFGRFFPDSHIDQAFLVAPLSFLVRLLPAGEKKFGRILPWMHAIDRQIFGRIPTLKKRAWYAWVNLSQ